MKYIKAVATIEESRHLPVFRPIGATVSHDIVQMNTFPRNNSTVFFFELTNKNSTVADEIVDGKT